MAYELFVYGAALGLPSVDPECLAAICYLKASLPNESWVAVETSDPIRITRGDLPLLRHNGRNINGLNRIVKYVEKAQGNGLRDDLQANESANLISLCAHIRYYALPLLDAHLYTASDNFTSSTRPAYNQILAPRAKFTLPHHRLAAAQRRTAPLGLSKSTIPDDTELKEAQEERDLAAISSTAPSLLFNRRKQMLQATLRQHAESKFRVEGLLEDLCAPLETLLTSDKNDACLFTRRDGSQLITKADCLLFGYLALILYPTVPSMWMAEALRKQHPLVASYIDRLGSRVLEKRFPRQANPEDILLALSSFNIPTAPPPAATWQASIQHLGGSLLSAVTNTVLGPQTRYVLALDPKSPYIFGTTGTLLAACVASVSLAYSRFWTIEAVDKVFRAERAGLARFGAAGAMLGALRG